MILSKKLNINISSSNITHYSSYYDDLKIGNKLNVNFNELPQFSNTTIKVKCDYCSKENELKMKNYSKYGYYDGDYLCKSCKTKKNNLEKYNVENVFQLDEIKEKIKNTINEKYNVDYISQSEIIKEKIVKTNIENYGYKSHLSSDIIKNKIKETLKDKYNVDNISKVENIKIKKKETSLLNNGYDIISKSPNFKTDIKINNIKKLSKKYNLNFVDINDFDFIINCELCNENYTINKKAFYTRYNCKTIICTNCNKMNSFSNSGYEIELLNFIKDNYKKEIITNSRNIIKPYEIDIFIPDLNFAIEFNGLYWHSDIRKDLNYHYLKFELCKEKNIKLVQIYSDDWIYKKELVKNLILDKLENIKLDNYNIEKIDFNILNNFMIEYSLIESCKSKINYGLYNNGELLSIIGLNKNKNSYNIVNFCNKLNIGLLIINWIIDNLKYDEINFKLNNDYYSLFEFEYLNFEFIKTTKPNFYYFKNDKRTSNLTNSKIYNSGYTTIKKILI